MGIGTLILVALAGWINRQQQDVVEYLQEEVRVLRELHGKKRLRFSDDQRRRLAQKAKRLGLSRLKEVAAIVSPQTLLSWHRKLIAGKYDSSGGRRRVGRPPSAEHLRDLVLRMGGRESGLGLHPNPRWASQPRARRWPWDHCRDSEGSRSGASSGTREGDELGGVPACPLGGPWCG
jgi:transposase-like protein